MQEGVSEKITLQLRSILIDGQGLKKTDESKKDIRLLDGGNAANRLRGRKVLSIQEIIIPFGGSTWALADIPTVRCFARNVILVVNDESFISCDFLHVIVKNYSCKNGSCTPEAFHWEDKQSVTA